MTNHKQAVNRLCGPGEVYGTLTVVRFITDKNMWECTCTCGKTVHRQGHALRKYKVPNCGCQKSKGRLLPNQLAHKRAVIADYRSHAENRGLSFELSDEEVIELISKSCHYCGLKPSNAKTVKPSRKLRNKYACTVTTLYYSGIDRINSDLGYTPENCVACCHLCNASKSDYTLEEWKLWVSRLYQKMFNDQSKDVGSNDPKRETPEMGEDMVCSTRKRVAG